MSSCPDCTQSNYHQHLKFGISGVKVAGVSYLVILYWPRAILFCSQFVISSFRLKIRIKNNHISPLFPLTSVRYHLCFLFFPFSLAYFLCLYCGRTTRKRARLLHREVIWRALCFSSSDHRRELQRERACRKRDHREARRF